MTYLAPLELSELAPVVFRPFGLGLVPTGEGSLLVPEPGRGVGGARMVARHAQGGSSRGAGGHGGGHCRIGGRRKSVV